MEEKKKGRPRKIPQSEATERYRSDPEELEKLKEKRLEQIKRNCHSGGGVAFGKPDRGALGVTADVVTSSIEDMVQVDLRAAAVNPEETCFTEKDVKEIKNAFESSFPSLGKNNPGFEKLTYAQIEALGKVCRTDEMLDEMLDALEEAGANQRWLLAAKASLNCAMMEIYRAVLKPKGI